MEKPIICVSLLNFDLNSIIFFDYADAISKDVLENHLIIPREVSSLNDLPLEWGNNPYIEKIMVKNSHNNKIRNVIFKNNLDFLYGNIISMDSNLINKTIINELNNLNKYDAYNNLVFICNKFANENDIDIYNICL